ncbi:phosphatidylserine decarboxylase [Deinococcus aestuarii]|uniref:phosphatidylserine decarboxylase n=1 Tax=Deinococcus aestuarii TaxID=2774531 RepID=UPI001C0B133D|nr:phosphatidylserine decarboxylase [Deinococcus aestuarii]
MPRLPRLILPLAALGAAVWYVRGVRRYRDPIRIPPQDAGAVLSPADGLVCFVRRIENGEVRVETLAAPLGARDLTGADVREGWLVGLHVGPLDVHFAYVPVSGTATGVEHLGSRLNAPLGSPGLLLGLPADLLGTRGAVENERHTTTLTAANGDVSVTFVAGAGGLNATTYLRRGDEARAGHKLAFLGEGGLVLLTLPAGATPQVSVGDRVTGAETVLARL